MLLVHPKIAEAAVIGQPDEIWGESVCAVVRPKPGEMLTVAEVGEFCQGKLASFKLPKRVIIANSPLPRNAVGKILKRSLREQYNQTSITSGSS